MTTILIVAGAIVVIGYFWYASIVSRRNRALEALSGIDVQLRKRSSLIPNILTVAQKFMDHERALLAEVTELRQGVDRDYDAKDADAVAEHLDLAARLGERMGRLMVAVEAYPDLKSDATMLNAQQSYSEVEANIAAARRFYNSAITSLNNAIQIFPGSLIAGFAGVGAMPFYETDEAARAPVDAGDYLK